MAKKNDWPTVSIVMPTLNSERTLDECLKSIREQDYPQKKVEILLVDGGSTDQTKQIAKKYKATIIDGGFKDDQEARKSVGLYAAKGEVVGYIDSDNYLVGKSYLKKSVKPLLVDESIVGTETSRYGIKPGFSLINRYFALVGVNDVLALYLKKNDKLPWTEKTWARGNVLKSLKSYTVVNFSPRNLPTMGGNGFFTRTETLKKTQSDTKNFFHVDVVIDLVHMGYKKFAMVNNEIYHDTAATLLKLAKRRMVYFNEYSPETSNRRYLMVDMDSVTDIKNLILFILATVTLLQPLLFSVKGYLKKPDSAWFLHIVVCWVFLIAYSLSFLKIKLKKFS